jgi:hypothetical protein
MQPATRKACALIGSALLVLGFATPSQAQTIVPVGPTTPTTPIPIEDGIRPALAGNNAPEIIGLQQQQIAGQKFRIFGRVADETPQSCGVVISGAATGVVLCDAEGNFDGVFTVATPGQIQAIAGDGMSQSGQSVLNLTNGAPTVGNFIAVQGPNNTWTFSGTVGDEAPEGLTVTLAGPTGVQGATATVLANGSWSVTLSLLAGTSGTVTATVADWYGQTGTATTFFGS